MDKQKQIEEMYADLVDNTNMYIEERYELAEDLVRLQYRKIPENTVVLTKEEYDELLRREMGAFIKGEKQGSKEMAEQIMNDISSDILTINTKEYGNIEVVPMERLQEIIQTLGVNE